MYGPACFTNLGESPLVQVSFSRSSNLWQSSTTPEEHLFPFAATPTATTTQALTPARNLPHDQATRLRLPRFDARNRVFSFAGMDMFALLQCSCAFLFPIHPAINPPLGPVPRIGWQVAVRDNASHRKRPTFADMMTA